MLFAAIWLTAGAGVLVLLIAAINRKNSRTCKSYRVEINGGSKRLFLDQAAIIGLLPEEKLTGKTIVSFDLRKMEAMIRKNAWIRDAQLFFDNNNVLRIKVTEREPVARIFTTAGNTFYIDSSGRELPWSGRSVLRLPVFTNFPEKIIPHGADSALVQQVKTVGWYILKDPFWMAAIEQVNITPDRRFQMVPVIGNHIIEFGDGDDYEQKFRRLFVFYREVMGKTGFDKYSIVDVQYAGQVIGTRKGSNISRFDSLQAVRSIQQLIRSAQQLQADTVKQQNTKPLEHNTITEQTLTNYDLVPEEDSTKQ